MGPSIVYLGGLVCLSIIIWLVCFNQVSNQATLTEQFQTTRTDLPQPSGKTLYLVKYSDSSPKSRPAGKLPARLQPPPAEIPKTIIQTYHDRDKIPNKVYQNIHHYAPGYQHIVYTDPECLAFIRYYYDEPLAKLFSSLGGAHRADLFRYCYLYQFGGYYLDIKIECIRPFSEIHQLLSKHQAYLSSVLSIERGTIFQGFIAAVPKHPIFLSLIEYIRHHHDRCRRDYLVLTRDFYRQISEHRKPQEGNNAAEHLFLFKEVSYSDKTRCPDGPDRYNMCCYITYQGEHFLKTRYADYPW